MIARHRLLLIALFMLSSRGAIAQTASTTHWNMWAFADRLYYEPLVADPRAARINLQVPAWSNAFPHSEKTGTRFAWQITLGREIPIVGWETEPLGLRRPSKGKLGFGIWTPVSFHMIEDFGDESNPIVDTDYRFGVLAKLQYGVSNDTWLALRFVPIAHESTHLGDEYTIIAQRKPGFERVNVSFEYYEYGVSLEHAFQQTGRLTVRHGGISLWRSSGYYDDRLLGQTAPSLTPSHKNYEPSFGLEVRAPQAGAKRQWIASVDLREKLAYRFHQTSPDDEQRHPSWSIAIGRASQEGDRRLLREYFLSIYRGVNPYGQLRTQENYWSVGLGWIFQ